MNPSNTNNAPPTIKLVLENIFGPPSTRWTVSRSLSSEETVWEHGDAFGGPY